ncbi:protein GDAP2 homolog [Clavelina lepadiformis]|uniref:protein GDAP2 homolog n=1 Tax=Clavelina lepadiformis TaxID=159417 RepID=UPI0040437667
MNVSSVIKIESLKPWDTGDKNTDETTGCEFDESHPYSNCKFKVRPDLNSCIYLCQGGIAHLGLDCVVLPINEVSLRQTSLAQEVHSAAGPLLANYYKTLKDIKTGSVILGTGYDLPARYIIHAKEPGISAKHQSAVETSLHRCYCNALQKAAENNVASIAFAPLYETYDPALKEQMAHLALGTVRCCLEKLSPSIQTVVFCVLEDSVELYTYFLRAYFPRSVEEAVTNASLIPSYSRGEWGERVDADRAIRITDLVGIKRSTSIETESESSSVASEMHNDIRKDIDPTEATRHSFALMSGDHDSKRMKQMRSMTNEKMLASQDRIYQRLLRLARTDDLSEIISSKALYLCGDDRDGAPVAVLVAKYINTQQMNLDKALLYFIQMLDSIVKKKYTLVYFHTFSQSCNHPPMSFIRRVYNVLDKRYRQNLKNLLMVHPTLWSRVLAWFFTTFSASEVRGQISSVKNIPDLYKYIAPDQIDIPPFVIDYDLKVNAEIYHKQNMQSPKPDGSLALEDSGNRMSL